MASEVEEVAWLNILLAFVAGGRQRSRLAQLAKPHALTSHNSRLASAVEDRSC